MDPLRWKYKIQVDVEETAKNAKNKGFSVINLEGQSRTLKEHYPLNQIVIKGGKLESNVKVLVSPSVTQVFVPINGIPNIEEFEHIAKYLEEVERILNDIVIRAPCESAKFGIDTETPVRSHSMLNTQKKLTETFHKALEELQGIFLNEFARAFVFLTRGQIAYAKKHIDIFLNELTDMQRGLIQVAKKQGIAEAEKCESELNEMILQSKRFEAELALAKSPGEFRNILDKYLSKASEFGN